MGNSSTKQLSEEEIQIIQESTQFGRDDILKRYEQFNQSFSGGTIQEKVFLKIFSNIHPNGDSTEFARCLFRSLDNDGNGSVDFSEFMVALSMSSYGSPEDKMKWIFNLYDKDNDGSISRKEIIEMITALYKMKGVMDESKIDEATSTIFRYVGVGDNADVSREEFIEAGCKSPYIISVLYGK